MSVDISGRSLIKSSLRLIGALGSEETPTGGEEQDAKLVLNMLIDEWETLPLTMLANTRNVFDLTANDGTYTIGPSGDFVLARPADIDTITVLYTADTPDRESAPLAKFTKAMWQALPDKLSTGTEPIGFYYEPTDPDGTLYLYPIPDNATNDLVVYVKTALEQLADLDITVTFPPAYAKALRYNLAVELLPEFGAALDATVRAEIKQIAKETLMNLKVRNVRMTDLDMPAGFGGDGGVYDILNDH